MGVGGMLAYRRGRIDALHDHYENVPFASIGGPKNRRSMVPPGYVPEEDREAYLRGYREQSREMFGEEWDTCEERILRVLSIKR